MERISQSSIRRYHLGSDRSAPAALKHRREEMPSCADPSAKQPQRGPGVRKHHHKHNLKHRYELLETLGRGTYGKVKRAIERQTGREVKCICQLKHEVAYQGQNACLISDFAVIQGNLHANYLSYN